MILTSPSSLPAIPDDLTVCQFMLDYHHNSRPIRNDIPCLIDDVSGRSLSLQEMRCRTSDLASGLHSKYNFGNSIAHRFAGPQLTRDQVKTTLVWYPNHIDYPIIIWAIHRLNGIFTGANPTSCSEELVYQIKKTGASFIFSHSLCLGVARLAAQSCSLPLESIIVIDDLDVDCSSFISLSDLIRQGSARKLTFGACLRPGEARSKVAALCLSSGTTGKPKPVAISHYSLVANILQMTAHGAQEVGTLAWGCHGYRPGDIILLALPLYHIAGFVCNLHFSLFSAMTLIVMPKYDLLRMLGNIVQYRITHLLLVPPQAVALCKQPAVRRYDLSSVKFLMCGAAPLSTEINQRLFDLFPNARVSQIYGLTETATTVSMTPMYQFRGTVGSVGTLLPGVQAQVVREDGSVADYGEPGELHVKTPSQALGYFLDDHSTRQTFVNGWVKTGDLVTISTKGELFILDRVKEILKVRGFQVAPAELEGCILDHPDVSDCCVVGRPDDYSGELPVAFVVLSVSAARQASQSAAAAHYVKVSIMKHVSDRKANYKRLADVRVVDSIPKNPSGKLVRRILRDRIRNQLGACECKL